MSILRDAWHARLPGALIEPDRGAIDTRRTVNGYESYLYVNRGKSLPMSRVAVSRRSIGARPNPETSEAILDAAADLLQRKGLKGLTTDAIAREARASKTTLYRWWPNRGALLLAIYVRAKGESRQEDTGSLVEDVARTYRRVFDSWRKEGNLFSLIIAEAQHDDGVAQALGQFRQDRVTDWLPTLKRARSRGELQEGADLEALAESIVAHAWFYLLTKRLDADARSLAIKVVGPWLNNQSTAANCERSAR